MEEQPRKLEYVIHVSQACIPGASGNQTKELYTEQAQDLVFNENILLQTLGFDVAVDHPHTHVVKTCHLVKGIHTFPVYHTPFPLFLYASEICQFFQTKNENVHPLKNSVIFLFQPVKI